MTSLSKSNQEEKMRDWWLDNSIIVSKEGVAFPAIKFNKFMEYVLQVTSDAYLNGKRDMADKVDKLIGEGERMFIEKGISQGMNRIKSRNVLRDEIRQKLLDLRKEDNL